MCNSIPDYLHRPAKNPSFTVGTLEPSCHNDKVTEWIVKGDPGMVEMVKRLFPGSNSRGRGICRFPNTKRNAANLNWLMLRFPLKVTNTAAWEQSYRAAVQHEQRVKQFNCQIEKAPVPMAFIGTLKEFQKEGFSYLCAAERALLADDMGLGKTAQGLAFIAAEKAYPALIVVMPHLILNWVSEIHKFLRLPGAGQLQFDGGEQNTAVHIIKGLKPYPLPPANIYIIHYGLLRGWGNALSDAGMKAVLFDEIQELRHTGTAKYSAASMISGAVPLCVGLSGTPIYNRGGEIWAVMNIIEYHCLGDWDSFTREWCTGYGSDTVKDPELLNGYLRREGLMLRRRKSEVLKELPDKRRVTQTIDFDSGTYDKLIQSAVTKAQHIESIKDIFERGRMSKQILDESRRAIGIAKAPYVVAFMKVLLETGERVLLFAYHHDVFDIYLEQLAEYHPVEITGRETKEQKAEAERAFMAGETNCCIISLRSSAGLNLQRANVVVFGELDWSPAIHTQAEDRAHRIGQFDSLLCYYLVTNEGADESIQEFLGLKIAQFKGIMGDQAETDKDRMLAIKSAKNHMKRLIEKLKNKHVA